MSQYISSFLIDPVVRQARRFSRPADDSSNPDPRPTLRHDDPQSDQDELAKTSTATHEAFPPLTVDAESLPPSTVTGNADVSSPTTLNHLEGDELHALRNGYTSGPSNQSSETPALQSEVNARRNDRPVTMETVNHPRRSVPDDLRSTTSSISNSVRSLMDVTMSPADPSARDSRSNTQDTRDRDDSGEIRSEGALPADDGMDHMRKRIIAIQRADSSNEVKARLVHGVMTEKHNSSQQSLHPLRAHSPGSLDSSERPFTPSSPKSLESLRQTISPPTSSSSNDDPNHRFQLSLEEVRPTYRPKPTVSSREEEQEDDSMEVEQESKVLGCEHYKRNVKLQCSACHRWYTCRFCHDAVEDHNLNRRETKYMLCMLCGRAQTAAEECAGCSERGAWYYCDICKLWDDSPDRNIYHCNDCGICRVGEGLGKDFFHCMTCSVCMSIAYRDTHRCIERSTDCDCPICGQYMFTSPEAVIFMRCGHSIHSRCYKQHMKTSYKCPICSRSIVNMERQFLQLADIIEAQPMPLEFRNTKAWVSCNDCSARSVVKYHWLGLKCAVCDSYNTAQIRLLSGSEAEAFSSDVQNTEALVNLSRSTSRGRSRHQNHSRQPTISAPPSALSITREILESTSWPNARARYAHSVAPHETNFTPSMSPSNDDSDPDDSMGEDDDEVLFWGGESPRSRLTSPIREDERRMALDGSSEEEDDDDSEDENMSDEDAEEDETDEYNRMEIFGHR